ncbi:MAG: hypothetical protein M0C28_11475 [Candidatus Moduliflexus flocculans]|nr:hypothetical protein [Candidatus Moduliflexus flocculans]
MRLIGPDDERRDRHHDLRPGHGPGAASCRPIYPLFLRSVTHRHSSFSSPLSASPASSPRSPRRPGPRTATLTLAPDRAVGSLVKRVRPLDRMRPGTATRRTRRTP